MKAKTTRKKKKVTRASSKKTQQAVVPSFVRVYLQPLLYEGLLIFTLAAGVFLLIALMSYHHSDPGWSHVSSHFVANATGKVGAWFADLFLYIFGYLAYIFPLLLGYAAVQSYQLHRRQERAESEHRFYLLLLRALGFIVVLSSGCALAAIHIQTVFSPLPYQAGGIIGAVLTEKLVHNFNNLGANLLMVALLLLGVTLFTGLSWMRFLDRLGGLCLRGLKKLMAFIPQLYSKKSLLTFKRLKTSRARVDQDSSAKKTFDTKAKVSVVRATDTSKPLINDPPSFELNAKMTENMKRQSLSNSSMPSIDLLDSPPQGKKTTFDRQKLEEKSREVELRLVDFGVQAKVVSVHPGPVVTRYELQLAAGTKVSKISGLAKDLARSLSVISVRVVEVIPGKSVIGLELPNESREKVVLQEVVASKPYQHSHSALTLALGKDISGHPVVVDLAKMPHLLVAGTTGSGKSVCLNVMLLSLLYKSSPEHLRLILIDPKMLELSVYDGIPHLLAPVVTDMKDAATALRWCVVEMERRYRLMASLGVRNIAGYNQKIKEAEKRGQPLYDLLIADQDAENKVALSCLPQIVVLADEFADMMVVVGKKVETLIARLAQKARASGIHLVLATQRPSVDVITGLIKANIPTRIAFQVSSKVDSRTIIDQQGAEQLLGHGDMLYLPSGMGVPIRVHGAYVNDDEVHRVVQAIKQEGEPCYIEGVLDQSSGVDSSGYTQAAMGELEQDAEKDPLYDQAVDAVVRSRRVSVSSIQRRFKIGYNRAARIVEAMEAAGVVSAMENNGNREVLAPAPHDGGD